MSLELTMLSGLSSNERQNALKWLTKQPEEIRIEVMLGRFHAFHSLRKSNRQIPAPVVDYCALLVSCAKNGWTAEKAYRSSQSVPGKELLQISRRRRLKASSNGKIICKKQEGIAKNWGIIVELRRAGISHRSISKYLLKHHKIKVSHTTIWKLWKACVALPYNRPTQK